MDSADIVVSAENFYFKHSDIDQETKVSIYDALTQAPIEAAGGCPVSPDDPVNILTVPTGAKYFVASDPIEIGTDTAYEVTITNEGTASAQQIVLACQMPKGLAFVQAAGPTTHRMEANTLQFHPIATLPAGESVKYRLHVRGTAAGDKRFRCRLTSTELSQPLFTEESTKFYGELTR